jgi:MFS family permease
MLGVILIYWVGKAFYDLADRYRKNKWAYAILGVVSYYGGIFSGGLIIGVIAEILSPGLIDESNERWFSFLAIPVGVLVCWGTYILLRNSWSKPKETSKHVLDSDLISHDTNRYNQGER